MILVTGKNQKIKPEISQSSSPPINLQTYPLICMDLNTHKDEKQMIPQ